MRCELTCPVHRKWSVNKEKFRFLKLTPSLRSTNIELNDIKTIIGIFSAAERSSSGRFCGDSESPDIVEETDVRGRTQEAGKYGRRKG